MDKLADFETVPIAHHEVNIDKLIEYVEALKFTYCQKNHKPPEYIKLPSWVRLVLCRYARELMEVRSLIDGPYHVTTERLLGLIVCATDSIDEIYEIEVF